MSKPPPPPKRPRQELNNAGTPTYEEYQVKLAGVREWNGWIPHKKDVNEFVKRYEALQVEYGPPSEATFTQLRVETDAQQYSRIFLPVSDSNATVLPRFMGELGIESLTGTSSKHVLKPTGGLDRKHNVDGLALTDAMMYATEGRKKAPPPPSSGRSAKKARNPEGPAPTQPN